MLSGCCSVVVVVVSSLARGLDEGQSASRLRGQSQSGNQLGGRGLGGGRQRADGRLELCNLLSPRRVAESPVAAPVRDVVRGRRLGIVRGGSPDLAHRRDRGGPAVFFKLRGRAVVPGDDGDERLEVARPGDEQLQRQGRLGFALRSEVSRSD